MGNIGNEFNKILTDWSNLLDEVGQNSGESNIQESVKAIKS